MSSTSVTERAGSTATAAASSVKVGEAPPAVSTGTSFTATTLSTFVDVLLVGVPSLATNVIVRGVVFGVSEPFE